MPQRRHRVAFLHFAAGPSEGSVQQAGADALLLADQAHAGGADVICFPEICLHTGVPPERWREEAVEEGDPQWQSLLQFASEHDCVLLVSLLLKSGEDVLNALVVFDRKQGHVGTLPKCRLTESELAVGLSAGKSPLVVESSIGRLGALTCFDLNFPELRAELQSLRPDLLIFPTMFRGGLRLQGLALELAAYVLSSNRSQSTLVDPLGRVRWQWGLREESAAHFPAWSLVDVNLDFGVFHYDKNAEAAGKLELSHPGKFSVVHSQAEGVFLIESRAEISVPTIERELQLIRSLDYFDEARKGMPA